MENAGNFASRSGAVRWISLDFIRRRKSFDVARSGWRPTAQSVNESRARWAMHSDNNLLNERFSLLRALAIVFLEGKAEGTSRCYLRLLWAMRIFFFPSELRRFRYLPLNSNLDDHARSDPLYFLVHKYYISKHFTLRQRLRSALDHHEFELRNFTGEYHRQVHSPNGLLIWERLVGKLHFKIVLIATDGNRHEGQLSVVLSVDNTSLCRVSFCYNNADLFGLPSTMTLLISRNQTDKVPDRLLFDKSFKHTSPQLLCLNAIAAIAMSNEFGFMLAIKHDAQIAYAKAYDSGFRNSYTALWQKFDAVEIDQHVYTLAVPLKLPPLQSVKHRARARCRREYCADIVQSVLSTMAKYRLGAERLANSDPAGGGQMSADLLADRWPNGRETNEASTIQIGSGRSFFVDGTSDEIDGDDLTREVYCVLGIPVDAIDMASVIDRIDLAITKSQPLLLSTPNLNYLTSAQTDAEFRNSLLRSDLCPPDGMAIVWLGRLLGAPIKQRVPGSDILGSIASFRRSKRRLNLFLFGGEEGVAAAAAQALNGKSDNVCCLGGLSPGFCSVEQLSADSTIDTINSSGADFIAVSLGARKGQAWLTRNHKRLRAPVRAHLGAALNFEAGRVKRAPSFVQRLCLEWLWRIKEEPYLWRRYLYDGLTLSRLLLTNVFPSMIQRLVCGVSTAPFTVDILPNIDNSVCVKISGAAIRENIDEITVAFRAAMETKMTIWVDFTDTCAIDARFLGLLFMIIKKAEFDDTKLKLANLSAGLKRYIRLSRAEFLCELFDEK